MMKPRILWVDDEKALLDSMRRQLRHRFDIVPALSGLEGLALLKRDSNFPVIVADLKMPGMNGIEFLREAMQVAPDSVRLMFTAHAGLDAAMKAVNEGHVFRFMTKPASIEQIERSLLDACRQSDLIRAEKELLEKTLTGSLQVLLEVLALASPTAFNRAARIRDTVLELARVMGITDTWALGMAASFVHIGYITLPSSTLKKIHSGIGSLDKEEEKMLQQQGELGIGLLQKIPRLEPVTSILRCPFYPRTAPAIENRQEPMFAAHLLYAAIEWDRLLNSGKSVDDAIRALAQQAAALDPAVIRALRQMPYAGQAGLELLLPITEIENGMVVGEDVYTRDGVLLVSKGYTVNDTVLRRLQNFHRQGYINDAVRVLKNV